MGSSVILSGRLTRYINLKLAVEHGENPGGRAIVIARPTTWLAYVSGARTP
ncbi:MAG: hypothetical protein Q4A92_10920 [Corynebacterium sp.]|nr:hypothetical protein [Corynebacterium sp.]